MEWVAKKHNTGSEVFVLNGRGLHESRLNNVLDLGFQGHQEVISNKKRSHFSRSYLAGVIQCKVLYNLHYVFVAAARASMPSYIYRPRSRGDNAFGSVSVFVGVCVFVCMSEHSCFNR